MQHFLLTRNRGSLNQHRDFPGKEAYATNPEVILQVNPPNLYILGVEVTSSEKNNHNYKEKN